jgi:hypothetical protein
MTGFREGKEGAGIVGDVFYTRGGGEESDSDMSSALIMYRPSINVSEKRFTNRAMELPSPKDSTE